MKGYFNFLLTVLAIIMLVGCLGIKQPTDDGLFGDLFEELFDVEAEETEENNEIEEIIIDRNKFIHFSFDDVEYCFANLKNNDYSSIWEEPFLAHLKLMNTMYGAKFSLYVWKNVLDGQPTKYKEEWQAASSWLKIGLHSESTINYASATYEQSQAAWNKFVEDVYLMTGTYDIVDRIPRLHNFAGNSEAMLGMKEADCGVLGFLAADDTRISYGLSEKTTLWLQENDYAKDMKNGLVYLTTDFRCERYARSVSFYNILKQYLHRDTNTYAYYIIFTHEYEVYDGTSFTDYIRWIEETCLYSAERGIKFDFPQNYFYISNKGDFNN